MDVLVNNADYGIAGGFNGSQDSEQLGMIDRNVRALVELTHIYWPGMLSRRRGGGRLKRKSPRALHRRGQSECKQCDDD